MFKVYPDYGIYKNNFPMLKKKIYEDQKSLLPELIVSLSTLLKDLVGGKEVKCIYSDVTQDEN